MLNHITIAGRLTADPELRRTQSGVAVTTFSLAVERDFKAQNGDRETDFFPVVAWRSTAEFAAKYFTKGKMAIVSGRLQTRTYMDKEGAQRKVTEIIADSVYFGGDKAKAASGGSFTEDDDWDEEDFPF